MANFGRTRSASLLSALLVVLGVDGGRCNCGLIARNIGSPLPGSLTTSGPGPVYIGKSGPGKRVWLEISGFRAGGLFRERIPVPCDTDGTFRIPVRPSAVSGADMPVFFPRCSVVCESDRNRAGELIQTFDVTPNVISADSPVAHASFSVTESVYVELWMESRAGKMWRVDLAVPDGTISAGTTENVLISLNSPNGTLLAPGQYRLTLLARNANMSERDSEIIEVHSVAGGAGGLGGAGSGVTTHIPGQNGPSSQQDVSHTETGASSASQNNNGVRDHGIGNGRDGHGQGKGQGSDNGKK